MGGTRWWSGLRCSVAIAGALGCSTPDPPHQATSAQISQMNQEVNGFSIGPAPAWSAMERAIRGAATPDDRQHWVSEYGYRASKLPQAERAARLDSLARITRVVP
jgi:DNA-binding transcriptional regulator YdaS (Cro superfamily)